MNLKPPIFPLLLLVLSGCQEPVQSAKGGAAVLPPVSVQVAPVKRFEVPQFYSATGYTRSSRVIEISTSQVAAIEEMQVKEGDTVSEGDLLIKLDRSELLASIKGASDAITAAQVNLNDVIQDLEKAKKLYDKQVVSSEEYRKVRVRFDLAKTQLHQAKQDLLVQQSRETYHSISSPINAIVTQRWVEQGDLTVVGKPLLQLEAVDGVEFDTAIPAKWASGLQVGEQYSIVLHHNKQRVNATISHIVNSADRETQTNQIRLIISSASKVDIGLSGQINFIVGHQKQLLMAKEALVKRAGVFGVFKLQDGKAVFAPVNAERQWKDYRVVLSGLEVGEQVVLRPDKTLKDGQAVQQVNG